MPHVMITGGAKEFEAKRFSIGEKEVLLVAVKEGEGSLVSLDKVLATGYV